MLSDPSVSFFLSFIVCQKVVDFLGQQLVKRSALCYQTVVCPVCLSLCDVGVLWPNGWMDQDAAWFGGTGWAQKVGPP